MRGPLSLQGPTRHEPRRRRTPYARFGAGTPSGPRFSSCVSVLRSTRAPGDRSAADRRRDRPLRPAVIGWPGSVAPFATSRQVDEHRAHEKQTIDRPDSSAWESRFSRGPTEPLEHTDDRFSFDVARRFVGRYRVDRGPLAWTCARRVGGSSMDTAPGWIDDGRL